jgi:uncharacterized membrane protein
MRREVAYKIWQVFIGFFVSFGFAFAVAQNQFLVALAVLAAGFALIRVLQGRYKSVVLSDERTKLIGEKAAQTTIVILMVGSAVVISAQLILLSLGIQVPWFQAFIEPLSYMILTLMLVYGLVTFYYLKKM